MIKAVKYARINEDNPYLYVTAKIFSADSTSDRKLKQVARELCRSVITVDDVPSLEEYLKQQVLTIQQESKTSYRYTVNKYRSSFDGNGQVTYAEYDIIRSNGTSVVEICHIYLNLMAYWVNFVNEPSAETKTKQQ